MAKRGKESVLSAKISSIINAAPDYGEEDDDFTKISQIVPEEAHSDSGDELNLAQFRKINIELLDAEDRKYAGIRTSRKIVSQEKAFSSDTSDESDNEIDTGSQTSDVGSDEDADASGAFDEGSDLDEDEDNSELSEDDDEESEKGNESDTSMSSGLEDNDIDESTVAGTSQNSSKSQENQMTHIAAKVISDVDKGQAIRNQINIWDSLLECRIKFQKCITTANKLPKSSKINEFIDAGGEDFLNAQKSCQKSIKKVLDTFLDLQRVCLDVNTDHYQGSSLKRALSDDEITSESDISENIGYHSEKKRRKPMDLAHEIGERHEAFISFRNDTIQKWNDKTRVTQMGSKDFSSFEQSTLKQIETVLADKNRLLKRTRTKRSNYHILGEDDYEPDTKQAKMDESSEIFDDDDFYHQLLRELLERKTSDVTDPVQLSRQWIQLQKERNRMKKTVDTKASKGRKVRYDIHQKLVNFMMPIDNVTWTDEARSELLVSLFGKKAV